MRPISTCSTSPACFVNSLLHPRKSEIPSASFAEQCHPGLWSPLHSHEEPELLYILEGSLEVFRSSGWMRAGVGEVVLIPGNIKHALRNSSSVQANVVERFAEHLPMALALVTKSELYKFFRELAKPFDAKQRSAPPTPEAMQELFRVAAKYGYWLASPEENAAIGLKIG
jgi:hypothetical protein